MSDIEFINTRFDPESTSFLAAAKVMAAEFGYTATLGVDAQLAQLLRLRVAQLVPCSYCLILHTRAAREIISDPRVDGLLSWRESELYSAPERAALAYCEALTAGSATDLPPAHDALAEHLGPESIAEIAAVVLNMNVWTRLKLAQGETPRHVQN
ncbi:carboxymuconolactone decarboxylase family protein [Paraoerskovia marina]|uniref:Alkylhydroperoxidase AhpD family core domain-containing protein n=1 Tax=Paraoerskovia marina TaxID=545619 RepID=A0A1H1UX08_9CELL|nr:carboxymuconolactone decarboxylase family protein [Paraoerskovia marina]SDS76626.1 alkylhydroperoxidase AhpD family core domain-containing protein [Paraoerskovia marina]